jgi:hypothetical protein
MEQYMDEEDKEEIHKEEPIKQDQSPGLPRRFKDMVNIVLPGIVSDVPRFELLSIVDNLMLKVKSLGAERVKKGLEKFEQEEEPYKEENAEPKNNSRSGVEIIAKQVKRLDEVSEETLIDKLSIGILALAVDSFAVDSKQYPAEERARLAKFFVDYYRDPESYPIIKEFVKKYKK